MIREDRQQLNERFVRVFDLLEERGVIVKNDRNGKGMGDFAEKVLGNRAYGHIIRAYLNPDDKRCIDYRQARILCREYGVNESYLIDGIGTPFGFDLPPQPTEPFVGSKRTGNIVFTTVEAFAGTAVDAGGFQVEDCEYFNIPGLSGGGLVAFPINGNSMEPIIQNGDIVICREISGLSEIKDNKIYAVKNNGSLWVKFVQRLADRKGRVTHLKLISANHLEHDPFEEEVTEYTRLYQVIRRISDLH
ncbi:MAG TPA: S24 family peptidase [Saprospiraceae bacterium]|nr:S24 family peptidase [Saprospiraceae bacterium]HMP24580.1 S24 family peptidase [Saprospiraceae bacterium]